MKAILLLLLFPLNSQAIFEKIYSGYKSSDRLAAIKLEEKIIEADFQVGNNKFDWRLELGTEFKDSFLQSSLTFEPQQTISNTSRIGLRKSSYQFGTFYFEHSQVSYDLSRWGSGSLGNFSEDSVYESKNKLTYSYDFLKKGAAAEWTILNSQNKKDLTEFNIKIQKDYFDFFVAYNDAKLRIMLDRLYKEFEVRAKRRVSLIKRRVKDGLSRNYELNQAKLSLLSQQETILKNTNLLREKVSVIENIIGVKISENEYHLINWTFKGKEQFPYIFSVMESLDLKRTSELNDVLEANLLKLESDSGDSLNFSLSYAKNAIEENKSDAFSNSLGDERNDEKVVTLVYSMPIGETKEDSLKSKLLLQRNKNKLTYSNLKGELEVKAQVLKENINRYTNGISLLNSKVKVAEGLVSEQQKLYLRGQVSFEELIRSEESLINARISKINMYSLYEQSLSQMALLSGTIIKFLNNYVD